MSPKKRSYSSAASPDDAQSTDGITFELDGVEFTCHGRISAFDLAEFAGPVADAGTGAESADPAVLRILADFLSAIMGPDTYRAFTVHRRTHHTPDDVVQAILFDIIEDSSNRPTPAPSPSPGGPPTPGTAPAGSPSPASAAAPPALDPAPATVPETETVPDWPPAEDLAVLAQLGDVSFTDPPPPGTEPAAEPAPRNVRISFAHPERPPVVTDDPTTQDADPTG
jgi:hypothetical protein